MCLIVFAWRPDHSQPLVVAANRDEFHARPSLPLGCWEDAPWIIGGRDLQAGGTWMGVTARGRFAALTNIRAPGQPIGARSRASCRNAICGVNCRRPTTWPHWPSVAATTPATTCW